MVVQGNLVTGLLAGLFFGPYQSGVCHRRQAYDRGSPEGVGSRPGTDGKGQQPRRSEEVLQHASMATRVGADPEKDACGASAILENATGSRHSAGEASGLKSANRHPHAGQIHQENRRHA